MKINYVKNTVANKSNDYLRFFYLVIQMIIKICESQHSYKLSVIQRQQQNFLYSSDCLSIWREKFLWQDGK